MIARLIAGGVAWVAALVLFAALLQWSGSTPPQVTPALDGVDALSRSLNKTRLASDDPEHRRWTVTKSARALHEMVIQVTAERPERATDIARLLVDPVRDQYVEVLVYVRAVDQQRDPVVRRVEWTPHDGYQLWSYR